MRQITVGLTAFSVANKDEIISSCTDKTTEYNGKRARAWVHARVEDGTVIHHTGFGNSYGEELHTSLEQGYAWPYIGSGGTSAEDGGVYQSPLDQTGRIRSYALNGCIGHVPDTSMMGMLEQLGQVIPPARSLGHLRRSDSTLFVVPEEMTGEIWYGGGNVIADGGWNLHGWIIDLFEPRWIDTPAYWGQDGINISFLDGHNEYHLWDDKELRKKVTENHTIHDGEDFQYMKSILLPGLLHQMGEEAEGG